MSGLNDDDLVELEKLAELFRKGTYYDVFGLALDFDRGDLKNAYYDLSRRFHPDRFYRMDLAGMEATLEEVFAGINEAYRVLGNSTERIKYDREMLDKKRKLPKASGAKKDAEAAASDGGAPARNGVEAGAGTTGAAEGHGHVVKWPRGRPGAKPGVAKPPPPPPPPPPERKPSSPAVEKMRQQIIERIKKARAHFKEGEQHAEAGAWLKAASAFYMATQFDANNEDYKRRFAEADRKSKDMQVQQSMDKGRKAESFRSHKEAEYHYEQATRHDPQVGEPFFRLAQMKLQNDGDKRGALVLLRKAVEKEPKNIEFHLLLAQVYEDLDLKKNANREFAAVLELKPDHAEAKDGAKRTRS